MNDVVPTFRELWDATWGTFRTRTRTIVLLTLLIQLPVDLFVEMAAGAGGSQAGSTSARFQLQNFLSLFIGTVWTMALISLTAGTQEDRGPGALLRTASERYMKGVGASILFNMAMVLGLILLIVPGIVMAVRYAFALQFVVLKGDRIRESLTSSGNLVNGRAMAVFRRLGACWLLVFAAILTVGVLNGVVGESLVATAVFSLPINLGLAFAIVYTTHLYLRLEGSHDREAIAEVFE